MKRIDFEKYLKSELQMAINLYEEQNKVYIDKDFLFNEFDYLTYEYSDYTDTEFYSLFNDKFCSYLKDYKDHKFCLLIHPDITKDKLLPDPEREEFILFLKTRLKQQVWFNSEMKDRLDKYESIIESFDK